MVYPRALVLLVLLTVSTIVWGQPGCACEKGEYCDRSGGNVCRALLKFGDSCTTDTECKSKYCLPSKMCSFDPKTRCKADAQCGPHQYCNHSRGNVCEALLKYSESCTKDSSCLSRHCLASKTCSSAPKPLCKDSSQCSKDRFCDIWAHRNECVKRLAVGATCNKDDWCLSRHCMASGKCSKDPKPLCENDSKCSEGRFCNTHMRPPVCKLPLAPGAQCVMDSWCSTKNCLVNNSTCSEEINNASIIRHDGPGSHSGVGGSGLSSGVIGGIVLGIAALLLAITIFVYLCVKKQRAKNNSGKNVDPSINVNLI